MSEGTEEDMPTPTVELEALKVDEAMEVFPPIMFFGSDEENDLLDMRPVPVEADREEEPAPKDLSAQESADTSDSMENLEPETSEETVPVEKDNGQPKESESGPPTSSSKTSAGKAKQTAST